MKELSAEKIDRILKILKASITEFYCKDEDLTKYCLQDDQLCKQFRASKDTSCFHHGMEQASTFRIGHYFCNQIEKSEFNSYDIDMEYNKHGFDPKRIDDKLVRPDLIVHQRGIDNDNFLVVEFKYGSNSDVSQDVKKLNKFTNQTGDYKYKIGILVILGNNNVEYRYFQDGQENKKKTLTATVTKTF